MSETFKQKLQKSGKGVLDQRAKLLADSVKIEADSRLNMAKSKVLKLQSAIANHEDLAVRSRDSLTVGAEGFDPTTWVKESISLRLELRIAKIEYSVIKNWHDELFPDNEETIDLSDLEEEEQ